MLNPDSALTKYINYIKPIVYAYACRPRQPSRRPLQVTYFQIGMWQIIHAFISKKQNWRIAFRLRQTGQCAKNGAGETPDLV
jgi:hypothetical protein